jgi:hypothetical protein
MPQDLPGEAHEGHLNRKLCSWLVSESYCYAHRANVAFSERRYGLEGNTDHSLPVPFVILKHQ